MKVIAINGSPKKRGNTYCAIQIVAKELEKDGIEVEILHIGNKSIKGCVACGQCSKNLDQKCGIKDEYVNNAIQKIMDSDGLILGSPVYFSGIAGGMKTFLDRVFMVAAANGNLFKHKVGASVVAVRRSGGVPTFTQLNNFINYGEMVMPSSNYWAVTHGMEPGEVQEDIEGTQIMRVLGRNMSWLLGVIDKGKDLVNKPEIESKVYTNFIR